MVTAQGAIAAIGNFDGVHRGHRALVERTAAFAAANGAPCGGVVFDPHPRRYFRPNDPPFLITLPARRDRLLIEAGVEAVIPLAFDAALAAMSPEQFVGDVLKSGLRLKGAVVGFVFQNVCVLVPLYALTIFLGYALQSTHAESWRAAVEKFAARVPLLGKARRSLAIARLSIALEALLNAGVHTIEAWEMAAAASGSPALRRVVARSKPGIEAGQLPSEMVSTHPEFPSAFAALYHSGEISGTLDDALRRSHVMFQEEGSRKMKQFVFAAAGALVAAVMLMAAWNIIKFYLGYFQQINDAINMNAK